MGEKREQDIRIHPFFVGTSARSLTITPSPMGMMFLFSEWLIMYMWSAVSRGPLMRSIEHGKEVSVTEKGVSQI
jgi:hypothetical protein